MMTFDSPVTAAFTPMVISTLSRLAGSWCYRAAGQSAPVSSTTIANDAVYIPFWIPTTASFQSAYVYNGAGTLSGNVDIGVYSEAAVRLASTGATAVSGGSQIQRIAFGPLTLTPGRYYLAVSHSVSVAGEVFAFGATVVGGRESGCYFQATAHPLPTNATFATWVSKIIPVVAISQFAF